MCFHPRYYVLNLNVFVLYSIGTLWNPEECIYEVPSWWLSLLLLFDEPIWTVAFIPIAKKDESGEVTTTTRSKYQMFQRRNWSQSLDGQRYVNWMDDQPRSGETRKNTTGRCMSMDKMTKVWKCKKEEGNEGIPELHTKELFASDDILKIRRQRWVFWFKNWRGCPGVLQNNISEMVDRQSRSHHGRVFKRWLNLSLTKWNNTGPGGQRLCYCWISSTTETSSQMHKENGHEDYWQLKEMGWF